METDNSRIIELHMMDKYKFFPMAALTFITVDVLTYPLLLIRSRLQVQKNSLVYKGTFDAFVKIFKSEGMVGFYRGFVIHSCGVLNSLGYLYLYEGTRHFLALHTDIQNAHFKSFLAGGIAELLCEPIQIPIDNVTQQQQIHSMGKSKKDGALNGVKGRAVISQLYMEKGLRAFYRGTIPSVLSHTINSSIYWTTYTAFNAGVMHSLLPGVPHLVSVPLSSIVANLLGIVLSNPVELVRIRVQVCRSPLISTVTTLIREEGIKQLFVKAVSARMAYAFFSSIFIILPYEAVKQYCLLPEYRNPGSVISKSAYY